MKKLIVAGATDQTIDVFIQDSTSTTGAGKTGLAYNTASLVCYYRKGATGTATALTLATQTVGGAHSDGGFVEIDATNMPGMYRLDLSDTIVASAGSVTLMLKGATGMAPCPIELQVTGVNLEAAQLPANVTQFGGSNGTFSGGRPEVNTSHIAGTVQTAGDIAARLPAALVSGRMDSSVGAMQANTLTASALAADSIAEIQSGLSTLDAAGVRSAIGLALANLDTQLSTLAGYIDTEVAAILAAVDTETAAILADTNALVARITAVRAGYLDNLSAGAVALEATAQSVKAKTDNLPASPAATGAAMTLTAAYDFAKGTVAMTESYAADGAAMTPVQAIHELRALAAEKSIAGTTLTAKKLDGTTTAATYTLDSATAPTSITRAT